MIRDYVTRQIEPLILEASTQFPAIVLTGPRQTGKSTLLKKLFPLFTYVTFDDPVIRESCRLDPTLFLENYQSPCIIDEIQYVPELLPYIKIKIDQNRGNSAQFILTGSQVFPLIKGLSESLAGRAAIFELYGINMNEYGLSENTAPGIFDRIFTGTYPDPLIHRVNERIFYSSYLQTYLERDIRQIQNVQDLSQFQYFLEILASRAGNLLNLSEIGKMIGLSQPTVKRWLSLLENSRIVYLLRPYFKNINKRIVKTPKLYFFDTGLLSYLLRYPDSKTLSVGPANGPLFENFVISELLKSITNTNNPSELFFYRDNHQNEIDLVIDQGYKHILCEIKMNSTIHKKHYQTLEKHKDLFTNPELILISNNQENIKVSQDVRNVPITHIDKIID